MTCNMISRVFQNMIYCRNNGIRHNNRGYESALEIQILNYVDKPVSMRNNFVIKTFYNKDFKYFDSTKAFLEDIEYFKRKIILKPFIVNEVNRFKSNFDENTVSVHIRTWHSTTNRITNDKAAERRSVNKDVVFEKIYKLMDERIVKNPNVKFFVAIDDFSYKEKIKERYSNVIFYVRNSRFTNVQNDFIELLLLGRTSELIGNAASTFTIWAWRLRDHSVSKKVTVLNHINGEISYSGDVSNLKI